MGWKSKEARHEYMVEYNKKNKEKISANKKEYYWANKELLQQKKKKYYDENKEKFVIDRIKYYSSAENRIKYILGRAKIRARQEGLEFNLTVEDITLPERCPYLGIILTHDLGAGQKITNSSLDRIDSTKGYIRGNVRIVSRLANTMKSNSTREQREAFANAIINNLSL